MKKILLLFVLIFEVNLSAQVLESFPTGTNLQTPSNYILFNNKMHYFARNASYEILLYATDGTTANNQIVKNLGFSFSTDLNDENEFNDRKIIFNNNLYFSFAGSLYKSDGTTAGTTVLLSSLFNVKYFHVYNNRLYFTAVSGSLGSELWSTDGTAAGTTLVKDINPGNQSAFYYTSYNPHFTDFNGKLFFVANDGVSGYELWSTDGTASGTTLFKDIRTNEGGSTNGFGAFLIGTYSQTPFKVVGSKMYFGANPYNNNAAVANYMISDSFLLYQTDGTVSGTTIVDAPLADPVTCGCGNNNYNYFYNLKGMTVYNNKLFFYGNQAFHSFGGIQNGGIYVVDGTNPISRLYAFWDYAGDVGTSDDVERYTMRMYNNEFYFLANTYASGDKTNLWKMNPLNNAFTQMTQTPSSGLTEFSDSGIDLRLLVAKEFNGRLFFVKTRPTEGKIFSTDGSVSGTQFEAKSGENANVLSTQAMTVIPNLLFSFGDALYFRAQFQGASAATLQRLRFTNLSNSVQTTSNFKIYPNPTTTFIHLNFDESLENANLKIVSLVGQTVLEKQNVSGPDFSCDVSNLSDGCYIIQITSGTKQFNTKFIKR